MPTRVANIVPSKVLPGISKISKNTDANIPNTATRAVGWYEKRTNPRLYWLWDKSMEFIHVVLWCIVFIVHNPEGIISLASAEADMVILVILPNPNPIIITKKPTPTDIPARKEVGSAYISL